MQAKLFGLRNSRRCSYDVDRKANQRMSELKSTSGRPSVRREETYACRVWTLLINHNRINVRIKDGTDRQTDGRTFINHNNLLKGHQYFSRECRERRMRRALLANPVWCVFTLQTAVDVYCLTVVQLEPGTRRRSCKLQRRTCDGPFDVQVHVHLVIT